MSHIVTLQVKVKDAVAVHNACNRLGLPAPVQGTTKLFDGEVTGLIVQLPEWIYPIISDTAAGQIKLDNFNGRWGSDEKFHEFLQAYAVCATTLEARRRGHSVTEQTLADGSIKLTIQVTTGGVV